MTKETEIVYCARCGLADSLTQAKLRKLHTGFSACCNENLLEKRPRSRCEPKVYTGNAPGSPIK